MSEFTLEHLLAIGEMKRKLELYEPVIKAAEAWWDDDDTSPKYAQFLGLAIEALREARNE